MKINTLPELLKLCKSQKLKYACLVDANENKIVPFNQGQTNIDKQFERIERRFNGELVSNGKYYVLLTDALRTSPTRHLIIKGDVNEVQIIQPQQMQSQEVLSWNNALQMTNDLAMLKAENLFLQKECELYKNRIAELETDIEILEAKQSGGGGFLNEASANAGGLLKENAPLIINFLDKHFSLKEREISLKESAQRKAPAPAQQTSTRKKNMIIGSAEHLQIIRNLAQDESKENELNNHLDLLERKDKAAHDAICNELNINYDEPGSTEN